MADRNVVSDVIYLSASVHYGNQDQCRTEEVLSSDCKMCSFAASLRTFTVSVLKDFTAVALNILAADPYNDYQRISEPGSLYNVICTLSFQYPTNGAS